MSNWSDDQARQIGKAIKALRGDRTGQWLADRTAELGHPISRTTISELEGETGRRKHVTTAELIVLAAALNTSPIALLYPGPDYAKVVEVLPGRDAPEFDAAQWFSGLRNAGFTEADFTSRQEYKKSLGKLELHRELWEVDRKIMRRRKAGAELDDLLNDRQRIQSQLGIEGDRDGG